MISGGLVLGILALVTGEWSQVHLREAVTTSGAAVLYLIVAGSLLAYSAYEWLLGHVSGRVAGTYAFVNPVVAVLLAWWLLSERIDARTGIAACVIVAGVVLLVATSKTGSADEADGIDAVKVESPNAGRVRSIP
jgi:drug/metabolite transporter (DMT)-like permease